MPRDVLQIDTPAYLKDKLGLSLAQEFHEAALQHFKCYETALSFYDSLSEKAFINLRKKPKGMVFSFVTFEKQPAANVAKMRRDFNRVRKDFMRYLAQTHEKFMRRNLGLTDEGLERMKAGKSPTGKTGKYLNTNVEHMHPLSGGGDSGSDGTFANLFLVARWINDLNGRICQEQVFGMGDWEKRDIVLLKPDLPQGVKILPTFIEERKVGPLDKDFNKEGLGQDSGHAEASKDATPRKSESSRRGRGRSKPRYFNANVCRR